MPDPSGYDPAQDVTPQRAADLKAAGMPIVDVREREEWDAGHIAGADWLPLSELGARWAELPGGELVVVCRSGSRSEMVCTALAQSGRAAHNLAGGMQAWAAAGLPIEPAGGHVL